MTDKVVYTEEDHPNWYHPVPNMRLLILGTYPPHEEKRKYKFYYPNTLNRFWKVIAKLADKEIINTKGNEAVKERQQLMTQLSIGVQNMGKRIQRKNKSSLDKDIKILEFHNLKELIDTHPELRVILLTGFTGESSTYHSFIRYLHENKIDHTLPDKVKPGSYFTLTLNNRKIKCFVGNSTSTAARKVKFDDLVAQFRQAYDESE